MLGCRIPITTKDGQKGLFFDESPETKALRRWKSGRFMEFEQELVGHGSVEVTGVILAVAMSAYYRKRPFTSGF
jgi:hypothetical protein